MQCFENSNDPDLYKRCQAYEAADKASSLLSEADSRMLASKNKAFPVAERRANRVEAKKIRKEAYVILEQAG